jgi:uncharacterized protein YyaL (SSP411 family)
MSADANLLAQEKSPYLLQHASNPVHWRPWGHAALQAAQAAHKPILLSVGYAACHWCHVMAHESFENAETAALMNRLFISIKVDREERPDIDHIYMSALHALGEQGGWPLTMFLAPDGTPFWGGTYFPPEPRWGRPSFRQILNAVADAYQSGDKSVTTNGATLMRALAASAATTPGDAPGPAMLASVANAYLRATDPIHGGLRGAPKFPNAPVFRFLWQHGRRTGQPEFEAAVHLMLRQMSLGGIYDHLGGGYARYSTDAEWLAPHFEKMLYDNAQLLELLGFAHAAAPDSLYAARAAETVAWLTRDITTSGAFACAEDADSEGEEGKFYVWSYAEITALLGPAAPAFAEAYDVTPAGNWEGKNILRRITASGDAPAEAALAAQRNILYAARATRPRPGRDDKILADWNGLMIAALARAAVVFHEPAWLGLAETAYKNLVSLLIGPDGRLRHAWRDGTITAAGLLDDHAAVARAALTLFETTGRPAYLNDAENLAQAALTWFADTDGSFFTTSSDAPDVPAIRPRTAADNATPNANGLMAETFTRLHYLTGDPAWRTRATAVITAFSGALDKLTSQCTLLAAADLLENATTIVIAGDPATAQAQSLVAASLASPDPATIVLRAPPGSALSRLHPAYGKSPPAGALAAAFRCQAGVCGIPILSPESLHIQEGQGSALDPLGPEAPDPH